jgi:hypothetical protein
MFLLYLDASGTADLSDTAQRVYVLLGLAIHEGNWFALERRVQSLKRRYALPGIALELHAAEICRSISEQDKIADFATLDRPTRRARVLALRAQKGRAVATSDGCLHLTRAERARLYEESLDLVGSHEQVRIFAEVIDKAHLFKMTEKRHAAGNAFEQVVSRFDAMLRAFDQSTSQRGNTGLLVADVDPSSDLMRTLTHTFRTEGHTWGALEYVIEAPFFVDSKIVSGIQLADMCAYAVRRYIEHGAPGSPEQTNFMRIFQKFDQANGRLHGLRHFVARGCPCAICEARGRNAQK